jgi:hypothetical protein
VADEVMRLHRPVAHHFAVAASAAAAAAAYPDGTLDHHARTITSQQNLTDHAPMPTFGIQAQILDSANCNADKIRQSMKMTELLYLCHLGN